jgi:hypothetical protein
MFVESIFAFCLLAESLALSLYLTAVLASAKTTENAFGIFVFYMIANYLGIVAFATWRAHRRVRSFEKTSKAYIALHALTTCFPMFYNAMYDKVGVLIVVYYYEWKSIVPEREKPAESK